MFRTLMGHCRGSAGEVEWTAADDAEKPGVVLLEGLPAFAETHSCAARTRHHRSHRHHPSRPGRLNVGPDRRLRRSAGGR